MVSDIMTVANWIYNKGYHTYDGAIELAERYISPTGKSGEDTDGFANNE